MLWHLWAFITQNWAVFVSVAAAVISGFFTLWTARQNRKASEKLENQKNVYARELAKQQSDYTAQIETLKTQLAFSLARKTKFADEEFKVLAELWEKLVKAHKGTISLYYCLKDFRDYLGGKVTCPQFSTRTVEENIKSLSDYSKDNDNVFSEEDIKFIVKQASDIGEFFFYYFLVKGRHKQLSDFLSDYSDYYRGKAIFIPPHLAEEFYKFEEECVAVRSDILDKIAAVFDATDGKKLQDNADVAAMKKDVLECISPINLEDNATHTLNMNSIFAQLGTLIQAELFPDEKA